MTEAVTFMASIGQAIASMRFYHEGHPARERAVDRTYRAARDLLHRDHVPRFTFADGEVVYHHVPLHELGEWEWARRLEAAGIQRIELDDDLTPANLSRFLLDVAARLAGAPPDNASRQFAPAGIRFGSIDRSADEATSPENAIPVTETELSLGAEIEAIEWIHSQVTDHQELPLLEAETVIRSLALAINGEHQIVLPLLRISEFDQYPITHSCNVAALSIAFAQHLGIESPLVRSLGISGLLHDIGNVRVPGDILIKPGRLDRAERELIEQHPIHGARILIERERHLELAAVVSYEHHQWANGSGYPRRTRDIRSHFASRLVQICDGFDALCADRPYRAGLPPGVALASIEAEAGSHYDSDLVREFAGMVRGSSLRCSTLDEERGERASIGGTAPAGSAGSGPPDEPPARAGQDDRGR